MKYSCRLGNRKSKLHIKMKIIYKITMNESEQSHKYNEWGCGFSTDCRPNCPTSCSFATCAQNSLCHTLHCHPRASEAQPSLGCITASRMPGAPCNGAGLGRWGLLVMGPLNVSRELFKTHKPALQVSLF